MFTDKHGTTWHPSITDEEVRAEAERLLEILPYTSEWAEMDAKERAKRKRQLKALLA